jgi:hypothetical protein
MYYKNFSFRELNKADELQDHESYRGMDNFQTPGEEVSVMLLNVPNTHSLRIAKSNRNECILHDYSNIYDIIYMFILNVCFDGSRNKACLI